MTDSRPNVLLLMTDQHRGDGHEHYFDLVEDPDEMHNLAGDPSRRDEREHWRSLLVQELTGRPEGFTDGKKLTPLGAPSAACLPGYENG